MHKIVYLVEVPNREMIEEVVGHEYDYVDKYSYGDVSKELIFDRISAVICEWLKSRKLTPLVYQLYDASYLDAIGVINTLNDTSCVVEYVVITVEGEEQEYDTNKVKEVIVKQNPYGKDPNQQVPD
jgi:hypothetical protein